jgi:hypothetical protein
MIHPIKVMKMDSKMITFLLAGILVGAGVGMAVGYLVFSEDNNQTYWFYIDFNGEVVDDFENGWISAKASSPVKGLTKALAANGMLDDFVPYVSGVDSESGWISSVGGLAGDWVGDGTGWGSWLWTMTVADSSIYGCWAGTAGFDKTLGTIFYIGFTVFDDETFEPVLDPNFALSNWDTTGPFKA